MLAKICVAVLGLVVVGTSIQNAEYFARGYFTPVLPMMVVFATAWAVLRQDGPPSPSKVFRPLLAAILLSGVLELGFGIYKRDPFDENGVITLLSVCQLLTIAFISCAVWKERNGPGPIRWKAKTLIWLIMAVGFLFLALDEKVLIHEGLDRDVHKILHMQETGWTSRIDDFLVGLYGIIGLVTLWFYSKEMPRFPPRLLFLAAGFTALFLCVAADASSSRPDFFTWLVGEQSAHLFQETAEIIEEGCKVLAEALFLTGFATALADARKGLPQG